MRRASRWTLWVLWAFTLALGSAVQLAAQPPKPPSLESLLSPHAHVHAKPTPANAPHTPDTIVDATTLGSPIKLEKGWRIGITDNPDAALPDFDDSTWAMRDAVDSFPDVSDQDHTDDSTHDGDRHSAHLGPHHSRYVWFRIHLKLAANHQPLFLLFELPPSLSGTAGSEIMNAEVYANGQLLHPEGPHGDHPDTYQPISRLYDLKLAPTDTALTLVLRTEYIPFGFGAYTAFFSHRKIHLGNRQEMDHVLQIWEHQTLFERIPRLVNSILLIVLATFLLALFYTQKGHVEYLWLALYELFQAPIGFIDLAGATGNLDHLWAQTAILQLLAISAYLYFEFLDSFLALRKRWFISLLRYSALILACIAPTMLLLGRHNLSYAILVAVVALGSLFWVVGWFVFVFYTLIKATLKRNFEAGLLLIPLVLSLVAWFEAVLTNGMSDMNGHPYHSPLTLQAGPIPIHFESVSGFSGIFVIVLIIFVRFLRIQRDQERASSELAAARSVQELMIPHEKLLTPGFEVESVYTPANEVGGDFYHVQSVEDGGLLVIVGDVAGKGLQAAMNVSMLMGALRRTEERSPAKILSALNRVLTGSDSFTTCQAALFRGNGELILANAGHLPPYLNSQEVGVPGGLPLGVLPDVSYDELTLYLHSGDRLLMLSDGVAEARKPSGELFGFDRVHNLSNLSAFYIADAAKSWGQQDDITVLTIRRQ